MKERKKFIVTLKQLYKNHKDVINITVLLSIIILTFVTGFLFSWNCLTIPLNNEQFELCEQIARDIYSQKRNVIVEVPEEFCVDITTTSISVKLNDNTYRGKVIAKLENHELVMTRDIETSDAVSTSVTVAVSFVLFTFLIIFFAYEIYKASKQRNSIK